jgi:drug/metabolite transporter (DMT)-like permease
LIVASIFLLIFFYFKGYRIKFSKSDISILIIVGIIGNFIPFFLISWAEQYIQSNIAGLLMSVGPIITLILAHYFTHDDKFTSLKLISVIIGLIGTLFIIDFQTFFDLSSGSFITIIAKLSVILAALGYMISNILAYNKLESVNTITITTFATLFGAIASLPFMIYAEINYPSNLTISTCLSIVYLGLFPTAIAFQFRYYITKKSGPVFLSNVAYLIPAFAVLWGYLILGETIDKKSFIGILLVLIGVYIGQKRLMNKKTN